jgi:hypothetical protein
MGRIQLRYAVRAREPLDHDAGRLGRSEDSAQELN